MCRELLSLTLHLRKTRYRLRRDSGASLRVNACLIISDHNGQLWSVDRANQPTVSGLNHEWVARDPPYGCSNRNQSCAFIQFLNAAPFNLVQLARALRNAGHPREFLCKFSQPDQADKA